MMAAKTTKMPMMANMAIPPEQRTRRRCDAACGCTVPALMAARFHRFARALQQLRQRFGGIVAGLRRADAHRERDAVAPPAEVRRARQSGQHLRVRRQHLRAALMRHDQKFIVAPAAHLLCRAQALRQRVPHLLQHRVARRRAVRLAQLLRLIDADPQNAKRTARPAAKSSNSVCSRSSSSARLSAIPRFALDSPCGSASRLSAG